MYAVPDLSPSALLKNAPAQTKLPSDAMRVVCPNLLLYPELKGNNLRRFTECRSIIHPSCTIADYEIDDTLAIARVVVKCIPTSKN